MAPGALWAALAPRVHREEGARVGAREMQAPAALLASEALRAPRVWVAPVALAGFQEAEAWEAQEDKAALGRASLRPLRPTALPMDLVARVRTTRPSRADVKRCRPASMRSSAPTALPTRRPQSRVVCLIPRLLGHRAVPQRPEVAGLFSADIRLV